MIYLILNIAVTCFFILYTVSIDRRVRSGSFEISTLVVALLIVTIESGIYTLVLLFHNVWLSALTNQIMRILFLVDGLFFINLSFGILSIAANTKKRFLTVIKFIIFALVFYIVYWHFNMIDISVEKGIFIMSEYIFPPDARKFFPWTWVSVYNFLIKFFLPAVSYLFLLVIQEEKATQLEKYQSILVGESLLLMWAVNYLISFISQANPSFSLLYLYGYLFMFVTMFAALSKTTVPSGKGIAVSVFKVIISYLIPAVLVGVICAAIQPSISAFTPSYITVFSIVAVGAVIFALKISDVLSSSSRLYTADYENSLEKDLAGIDYNGEMDEITNRMFEIMRRNVESSSMNVYIVNSGGILETAYSSNGLNVSVPLGNPAFDVLMNINKSVVIYSEVEKEHAIASVKQELYDLFAVTKSDAFFILNEGHNILGIITLGAKVSGDHYKEYDYNVFTKLYSYFFVFGYYMRNISNKDIIGTVNREIRMSSQIITSIQENIDHLDNPKIDTGYLMVPAHNIGGEFIDFIRLTATRHLFVVGDLSGKGIAASMSMVILKSIIRTYLAETHDFKELVVKVNSFVRDSLRKGTIFAGLFALIDFDTDTMYYINCGVPALFIYTQVYNNVIEIQGTGHILGFVKDISPFISVKTTKLSRGDIILACTDGLIQSHSLRGEQFGKERVQQAILDNSTYPAQRMAQFTFDSLVKFMSKEMEDDVSILVLKYESSAAFADKNDSPEKTDVAEPDKIPDEADSPVQEQAQDPEEDAASYAENEIPGAQDGSPAEPDSPDVSAAVRDEEQNSAVETDSGSGLPDGFEMPDLSSIDEMIRKAGL